MSDWTVLGEKDDGTVVEKDATSRSDAEATKAQAEDLGLKHVEIVPPGDDEADDGEADDDMNVDVVEHGPDADADPDPTDEYDLPDDGPSVDEDPLVWMPDEFTKTVDGTVTITRKGFEVLAHHYDVSGGTDMVVSPVETDMEYTVHKATVTDADGNTYEAYGEAHAGDNGVENIVRMSDTRAYKRAVSRATGVGTVAIEEIQNEL